MFCGTEPSKFGRIYHAPFQAKIAAELAGLITIVSVGEGGIAHNSSPVHTSSGNLGLGSQEVQISIIVKATIHFCPPDHACLPAHRLTHHFYREVWIPN